VLDAATALEERIPVGGHVARGVDARRRSLEALVDDDAVLDLQPGLLRQAHRGIDPVAEDGELRLELASPAETRGLDVTGPEHHCQLFAREQLDTLLPVELVEQARELVHPKLAVERVAIHEDDVASERSQRGGDLHADEPRAGDDRARTALGRSADALGVVDPAEGRHAVEVGARDFGPARHGARREHEPVPREPFPALELDRAAGDV
jgi:hypothetical protein